MSRAWTAWLSSTPPSSVVPPPAPGHRVVLGPPPPGDLDRRVYAGPATPASTSAFTFWRPLPNRYWKIGMSRPALAASASASASQSRERRDQRLLAHDVLAGRQGGGDLLEVERRRRAEVDDVDVVARDGLLEGDDVGAGALGGVVGACLVGVGHGDDGEAVLHPAPRPHVHLPDAEPDDRDPRCGSATSALLGLDEQRSVGVLLVHAGRGDSTRTRGRCAAPWCSR